MKLEEEEAYIDKTIMILQTQECSHNGGISNEPGSDNAGHYGFDIYNSTFSSVKSYL